MRAVKGTCTEYNLGKNSFKPIGISQLCVGIQSLSMDVVTVDAI